MIHSLTVTSPPHLDFSPASLALFCAALKSVHIIRETPMMVSPQLIYNHHNHHNHSAYYSALEYRYYMATREMAE